MASTNKCLAQSNKSRTDGNATKKRKNLPVGRAIRALAKLANGKTHFGSVLPTTSSQSNHAGQVRGHRYRRQGAQAQQHEPRLLALRRNPLRRAPAEQVLAQGRPDLQPRRMGGKLC